MKRDEEASLYEQSKATTVEDMLAGMYSMEVTVTDPIKEEDKYISYQVNTKVTKKQCQVFQPEGCRAHIMESMDIHRVYHV